MSGSALPLWRQHTTCTVSEGVIVFKILGHTWIAGLAILEGMANFYHFKFARFWMNMFNKDVLLIRLGRGV